MQVKRLNRNKRQALLLLAGTFCAGAMLGAVTASFAVKEDKPTTEQLAPETVRIIFVEEVPQPEPKVEAKVEPEAEELGEFKLTAYCPCEKCCGDWADGITYTGTQATQGRTIAVDPKVIPLGSTVLINGENYIAEDIGGAIKGNRIDVYFASHADALQFGVQYAHVSIQK